MKRLLAVLLPLTVLSSTLQAEPPFCGTHSTQCHFFERACPAGGCKPYGGRLLCWWPRHCFPRYCAPDDYCRKPLPVHCRRGFPEFYRWDRTQGAD